MSNIMNHEIITAIVSVISVLIGFFSTLAKFYFDTKKREDEARNKWQDLFIENIKDLANGVREGFVRLEDKLEDSFDKQEEICRKNNEAIKEIRNEKTRRLKVS